MPNPPKLEAVTRLTSDLEARPPLRHPFLQVNLGTNVTLASVTLFAPALKSGEVAPVKYNGSDTLIVRLSAQPSSKTGLYTG